MSEVLKSDTELLGMFSDNIGKQTEQSGRPLLQFQFMINYSKGLLLRLSSCSKTKKLRKPLMYILHIYCIVTTNFP